MTSLYQPHRKPDKDRLPRGYSPSGSLSFSVVWFVFSRQASAVGGRGELHGQRGKQVRTMSDKWLYLPQMTSWMKNGLG